MSPRTASLVFLAVGAAHVAVYDLGYPDEPWVGHLTTALLAAGLALLLALWFGLARRRREDQRSRARV